MAKQKELEGEGRAEVAWGGTRDERQREKLCLRVGGDGTGKQKLKTVREVAPRALTSLLGLGVGSMRLGSKEPGTNSREKQRQEIKEGKGDPGGAKEQWRSKCLEHTGDILDEA